MKNTLLFLLSFFFVHVYGQNAPVMQKEASGNPLHLESYAVIERGKFENRTRNDESLVTGKEDVRDRMVLDIGRITETDRYILK